MNNNNEQALFGLLADRYDVGFSQDISDRVTRLDARDIQFLEIKELNDLCAAYRVRIRALIQGCRTLRKQGKETASVLALHAGYEEIFTKRQIVDLWKLYRIAMADSHEMTAVYLACLSGGKNHYRFSLPSEEEYREAA